MREELSDTLFFARSLETFFNTKMSTGPPSRYSGTLATPLRHLLPPLSGNNLIKKKLSFLLEKFLFRAKFTRQMRKNDTIIYSMTAKWLCSIIRFTNYSKNNRAYRRTSRGKGLLSPIISDKTSKI